jgi:hypothetical protein
MLIWYVLYRFVIHINELASSFRGIEKFALAENENIYN